MWKWYSFTREGREAEVEGNCMVAGGEMRATAWAERGGASRRECEGLESRPRVAQERRSSRMRSGVWSE